VGTDPSEARRCRHWLTRRAAAWCLAPVTDIGPAVPDAPEERNASVANLESVARAAINDLATLPEQEAFEALLRLSAVVGENLGVSARTVAAGGSWAKVAEVAGTTRQAAWSRWST